KTALLSYGLLVVLVLLERRLVLLIGPVLLGFIVAAALNLPQDSAPAIVRNLQDRINTREMDETAEGRGYDRIVNHPEHLIFGAGLGQSSFPRVLIIGTEDVDTRVDLMRELQDEFSLAAAGTSPALQRRFADAGFDYYRYPLPRGTSPARDLYGFVALLRL